MNIDNVISSFDFDQFKSDCLVHSSLKAYIKKDPNLPSCYDSDFIELYLKNAVCFPSECANCVGMNKCNVRKFVYIPKPISKHKYVLRSEPVHMPDLHE